MSLLCVDELYAFLSILTSQQAAFHCLLHISTNIQETLLLTTKHYSLLTLSHAWSANYIESACFSGSVTIVPLSQAVHPYIQDIKLKPSFIVVHYVCTHP